MALLLNFLKIEYKKLIFLHTLDYYNKFIKQKNIHGGLIWQI